MSKDKVDQVETCINPYKWISVCLFTILFAFGVTLQFSTHQNDFYNDAYIAILSFIGFTWLLLLWIDIIIVSRRLRYSDDLSSDIPNMEWTYYIYLKTPHLYCFYLKAGLTVFCLVHLILTTAITIQETYYVFKIPICVDKVRLLSSVIDLLISIEQLFFIEYHMNIAINRMKNVSRLGCMILIAVALLKWLTTIISEAYPKSINLSQSNSSCSEIINVYDLVPFIDPFTIEFNFLLAIQWFVIWVNIGTYKRARSLSFWLLTENLQISSQLDEITQSETFHRSEKGLIAGMIIFIGSLLSLYYYSKAVGQPDVSNISAILFVKWEDLIYLICSLSALLIGTLQLNRLVESEESSIGSHDLLLLFLPLIAVFIQGYIKVSTVYSANFGLIDKLLEAFAIIQPLYQAFFIYFGRFKACSTQYLIQRKPGRQIIIFLIFMNLVLWVSGAFRSKIKDPKDHNLYSFVHLIILDLSHPFILFYRYHSSVCLANIWKIVYDYSLTNV